MTVADGGDAVAAALAAPVALVVSVSPGETRLARLEHGRCVAVTSHRPWAAGAGAVLLGRLGPRLPSGGGAFVDLGPWGDGFLDPADLTGAVPPQGAAVMAQVRQPARPDEMASGGKAARLTLAPALTSARLALGGRRPGAAVSRRLPEDERARLLGLIKGLVAPGESLVARTAAAGADRATLARDLARLRADWTGLTARAAEASSPALLSPAPLDWKAVLSPLDPPPSLVVLDEPAARDALAADLRGALEAGAAPAIVAPAGAGDLWEATGVADTVEAALSPVVPLPGGGRLVIEPTAALVAVDVDAGSGPPARANAEALAALPGQLRLRALAGHILVDLIPAGRGPRLPMAARQALERALSTDPAAPRVAGVSRLGLLEVSRDRRGPTLAETMRGPAAQALAALRLAVQEARASAATALAVTVSPPAAALLRGPLAPAAADLRARRGLALTVRQGLVGVDAVPVLGPP